jgi:RNA polymerase sigma-70 factor (ECF subfamily)
LEVNNININSEDSDIIESFINGNESAFNYLVLKYQRKIYWVIRKMVLDHDDADDITQEVFVKLYKSLKDFRGESSFYTYLYKIAVNYSLNYLKKQKKVTERTKDIDDESYKLSSDDALQDEGYDEAIIKKVLTEAIKTLPEQQRAVFNLRFYDNLNYEEISKIMKKSVGGMKANYFHAVKKIEEIIRQKRLNGTIN